MPAAPTKPLVALFVTCLVDAYRPSVGFASLRLLERVGVRTRVPRAQTCCGQPAFNNGDDDGARAIARQVIEAFRDVDRVVVPSGSCGGMLKLHYPELFDGDPLWAPRARAFAAKVVELGAFLLEQGLEVDAEYRGVAAYHDSCSSLRELGVREQPRQLLAGVRGLEVRDLTDAEVCCGFGGTFCVKYGDISTRLVSDKAADVLATGADTLLAGDLGCLLNIAGRLQRQGSEVRVFHYAELLAGLDPEQPAIGEPSP
ncbi:MAG: (Fe-S)-binding protein [Gammaproteobacteria bacterium]|jgi:L-lactate dehydrogenase complex protein LldE